MQINSLPQPALTGLTPSPQAIAQTLPQVQALASAPLTQRAVAPSTQKEKMRQEHTTKEKFDSTEEEAGSTLPDENAQSHDGVRGHFINTSV